MYGVVKVPYTLSEVVGAKVEVKVRYPIPWSRFARFSAVRYGRTIAASGSNQRSYIPSESMTSDEYPCSQGILFLKLCTFVWPVPLRIPDPKPSAIVPEKAIPTHQSFSRHFTHSPAAHVRRYVLVTPSSGNICYLDSTNSSKHDLVTLYA